MAGHNKWSKIKRQKGVNDAKRGAIFTRIGNQIAIAARSGTDPDMNPGLAMAIEKARAGFVSGEITGRLNQHIVNNYGRGVALLATGRQVFAKDAEQQGCEGWVAFIGGAFSRTSSASRPSEGIGDARRAIGMQADITATIFGAQVSYIEIR